MSRRPPAARKLAVVRGALLAVAVCASARTAFGFETLERLRPLPQPHRAAYACALLGAGLVAASFPLTDAADRRYVEYEHETNPSAIEGRWNATVHADHLASGALLGGESMLVAAVYLRFLRSPPNAPVALRIRPASCALCWSY
jgi:hypothetical protein